MSLERNQAENYTRTYQGKPSGQRERYGVKPRIDITGRENFSTTDLARTEEFRRRVRDGMRRAGIGSSFVESPEIVYKSAKRTDFDRLTAFQRQVLNLRYESGLTQARIAEMLGKDPKIISRTERRAMLRLKGDEDKQRAKVLLETEVVDLNLVPGLTQEQRKVIELRYKDKLSGRQVGAELGINHRRVSEIENAALNKIGFMVAQMRVQ